MTKRIITKNCIICNKEYKPNSKTSKYCSVECYRSLSTKTVLVNCHTCKKEFEQDKSKADVNIKNFCSRKCYLEDHKAVLYLVQCKGCGKDIKLEQNRSRNKDNGQKNFYCSDGCRRKKTVSKCIVCGVLFSGIAIRDNRNIVNVPKRTCGTKCLKEFYRTDEARKEKISIAFSGDKHPNYVNGVSKNGRVRKTDLKENFSNRDKRETYKRFNNQCFKCGTKEDLTVDHNLPFCMGGRLTKSNCVILCRSCNSSKNAKHPTKFYKDHELKKLKALGVDHNNLFNFIF